MWRCCSMVFHQTPSLSQAEVSECIGGSIRLPHSRSKIAAISSYYEALSKLTMILVLSRVTTPPARQTRRRCRRLPSHRSERRFDRFLICFLTVWRPSGSQIPRIREMSWDSHHPAMMDPPLTRLSPSRNRWPDLIRKISVRAFTISALNSGYQSGSVAGPLPPSNQTTTQACETRATSSRDR
jgi:hypothetical protein